MRHPSTRRTFLTTLGTAGILSLAGCSTVLPTGPSENATTPTASSTSTEASSPERGTDTPMGTGTGTPRPSSPSLGKVVDDFEGAVSSRWQASTGKYSIDKTNPYKGNQSLVLTGQNNGTQTSKNGVSIYRSFYELGGLDLRTHDLSLAVRFEQPVRGRISVEFIAPAESSTLISRHFIPKEFNGWTHIDLGYTGKTSQPVMKAVQELRISVSTSGKPITVAIDDIRKIPKAKKGKVMFQFDDSHITQYTKAFPKLREYGWAGGIAVIPSVIGKKERMTRNQMRKMGNAGWDMMSHPHSSVGKPLPQLSLKKQERLIRSSKQALEARGFTKGARHIVAPNGRVSTQTIELMQQYHDANYMFGGSPGNAAQPSNMYAIPRVFGTSPDAVKSLLDLAEQSNQMVVIEYHEIGGDTDTSVSMEDFESVLNHVQQKQMDVVSPSQFLDSIQQ